MVHAAPVADFAIGKAITMARGSDVCLLSTGNMLPETVEAAHELESRGISAEVISFHTVKPLDEECLADVFARFPLVASIEEHSRIGGFGAAVAEWLIDNRITPRQFIRFGTPDAFFKQSGEQEFAREALGLSAHQIAARITDALRQG